MLFHITQSHTADLCPKDEGGSKTLYNPAAEGVKLVAMYGAFPEHVQAEQSDHDPRLAGRDHGHPHSSTSALPFQASTVVEFSELTTVLPTMQS